jgi:p-aminobenzoyl-glutamate transporter AbgT
MSPKMPAITVIIERAMMRYSVVLSMFWVVFSIVFFLFGISKGYAAPVFPTTCKIERGF